MDISVLVAVWWHIKNTEGVSSRGRSGKIINQNK
jgi:hypothetical protein